MSVGWPNQPGQPGQPGAPGNPQWGYAPPPPLEPPRPQGSSVKGPPAPAPRPVPSGAIGWNAGFMLMFGSMFGGIPMIIFFVFMLTMPMPWEDWILDYRGEKSVAQALSARATNTSVNESTLYDVDVQYSDKQNRPHRATLSTLNYAVIKAPVTKAPLNIEYDPEDFARVRLQGDSISAIGFMAFMPLGFGCIGMPLVLIGLATALGRRKVYKHGTPAQARIQEVTASASSQNDQRVMIAHYSFQTPRGIFRGQWKTVTPPGVGEVIWVLYDPKNPKRSLPA